MAISPLNAPVNTAICSSPGTIFSSGGSGSSGGGTTYDFQNIGNGAKILAPLVGNVVPLRTIRQGANISVQEEASDVWLNVNDLLFDTTTPSTSPIPGLTGVTLGAAGVLGALKALIYPIRPPVISLNIVPSIFEFGDTTILTINWSVTRTDEDITSIVVNGQPIVPTGQTQSGSIPLVNPAQGDISVSMSAATATKNASTSATSSALRKIRYGYLPADGIINPITDDAINTAATMFGSFYKSGVVGPYTFTVAQGNYLVIIIPTAFGINWGFLINGFNNNAFNLIRNAQPYINKFGYSDQVNIWVSQSVVTGPILLAPYQTS